ncbi:MAG: glyceraldehyde-3-phosphate dehydrogenase [Flavobacteriales bacterium]|nr:glyceraldehyde-3-phosphate dehydrogenase [Flavobacteriales bacterium]|tara:strand:+ start:36498 stop:37937 length:1440 start_codon:yes stop_codon:yes gene_type:complete
MQENYSEKLDAFIAQEKAATNLIKSVGDLLYEKGIELVLFRRHLIDKNVSDILRLHQYATNFVKKPISIFDSAQLAMILTKMDLAPAKIDIGKLAYEYESEKSESTNKETFLNEKIGFIKNSNNKSQNSKDVVLYGFGRIGRLCARELIKQAGKGQQLRLKGIILRKIDAKTLHKRCALLRQDSVHGSFSSSIEINEEELYVVINGQKIQFFDNENKYQLKNYGINDALLIDNTGVYKDYDSLKNHLKIDGISKVLLTAPGAGIPNIVYGVNQAIIDIENDTIISAASCTTNAIAPILKVINDNNDIIKGHIETIHAYTNDQNLLDNMHSKNRRGRSAAINMVITSTGAGKAVTKVIPGLENKLTANAIRVPTPNGSLAIINLSLNNKISLEKVNELIRKAALEGPLVNQIKFSMNTELVSSDIVGNEGAAIFDSPATIVSKDQKNILLYIWYDNEFGYTKQVIRLAKYISKVRRLHYY